MMQTAEYFLHDREFIDSELVKHYACWVLRLSSLAQLHVWRKTAYVFATLLGDRSQVPVMQLSNRELSIWNTYRLPED